MKVINLNKFKDSQKVELDGEIYSINTVTVGMFINSDAFAKMEDATPEEQRASVVTLIEAIASISNIPVKVLYGQPFTVLSAIIQIAQGTDPEEQTKDDGGSEGK